MGGCERFSREAPPTYVGDSLCGLLEFVAFQVFGRRDRDGEGVAQQASCFVFSGQIHTKSLAFATSSDDRAGSGMFRVSGHGPLFFGKHLPGSSLRHVHQSGGAGGPSCRRSGTKCLLWSIVT